MKNLKSLPRNLRSDVNEESHYVVEPQGIRWRSHTLFIVSTVIVGLFSETFLYGIVIPVLPFILQDRIGISQDELQSHSSILLAAYAGSSVIFCPITGALGDKLASRKLLFIAGLVILIISTVLFFLGQSMTALVIARCAQGASCAFIWTAGFALCFDTVGSENTGKTLGMVLGFVNLGALFSPPLGGTVYSLAGLPAVATIAMGLLAFDLIMRLLLIEKKVAARYISDGFALADQMNPETSSDSSSLLTSGKKEHSQGAEVVEDDSSELWDEATQDEVSPMLHHNEEIELGDIESQVGSLPIFNCGDEPNDYHITHRESSILNHLPVLLCLRNSSLVAALVTCGIQSAILSSFDATVSLEARELFDFNPVKTGLLFVPLGCFRLALAPLGGWAVDRFGTKVVATGGYMFLSLVLAFFRVIKPEPRDINIALYCILLALSGIGMAMVGTPSFVEARMVIKEYHEHNPDLFGENGPFASISGMNLMVFNLGMTFGPLIAGHLRDKLGYGNMNTILALLASLSAAASFLWLGGKPALLRTKL